MVIQYKVVSLETIYTHKQKWINHLGEEGTWEGLEGVDMRWGRKEKRERVCVIIFEFKCKIIVN